ncbi:kinesin-like protein KIN12B-like, partial [Trifolium medium]|nr:kinesin-like protein KIN12B-like [Trifolium medium]
HLVDALTKETCSGKADVPNRNSCLTRLLHESLGGNAKLSVICSIYPDIKNNGETLRTLRFGQRVRSIRNEPVINEIKEDDVNDLSDQIRQLKNLLEQRLMFVAQMGIKTDISMYRMYGKA